MKFRILISQLNFPEGPSFDSLGNAWCTEILAGNLVRYMKGETERFHVGERVNGTAVDSADRIWFTDSERGIIGVFDPQKRTTSIVCDQVEGQALNRPNDLAFDRKGNLIVSCHGDGRTEATGSLVVLDRANYAKTIVEGKYFTNGIAFSMDGKEFFYSETYGRRVWKAQWDPEEKKVISEVPWAETDGPIGPDGIALDRDGKLYVTVFDQGKIDVIDAEGKQDSVIPLPFPRPTSCAFDPSGKLGLLVTEAGEGLLLSLKMNVKGAEIFKREYERTEKAL